MPNERPTSDELRAAADRMEEQVLNSPAATPPLVIGGAQDFPRPAPEDRLQAGGGAAVSETTRVVGLLRDIAAVMDEGNEPPVEALATIARFL